MLKAPTSPITTRRIVPITTPLSSHFSQAGERADHRAPAKWARWSAQALDDHGVGHAAALTHHLQAPAAVGALELVQEGGGEAGAGAAERVTEGDGTAVHVDLRHVGVVLLFPREHHGSERLVDLDQV